MSYTFQPDDKSTRAMRWGIYWMLIIASAASMCGRIAQVKSEHGTPFLSANDRSRWATIRELVDEGTYAIDNVHTIRGYHTIDKVKHPDENGIERYYSSKPPLLPTLVASQYFVIKKLTGETLETQPLYIGRIMLVLTNVLPMVLYFVLLAAVVEKWGTTTLGRVFVMVVATFGTFLTTFAVTLNNHLPAAIGVMMALYAANEIWYERNDSFWLYPLAGIGAAFAAANELPALSFLVLLGFGLILCIRGRNLNSFIGGIFAAALVIAAFFGTNYIAHRDIRPPYMHRGKQVAEQEPSQAPTSDTADAGDAGTADGDESNGADDSSSEASDTPATPFYLRLIEKAKDSTLSSNNWYDFEGSYDFSQEGEPWQALYAANVLIGHHGILSLTPVWILSVVGAIQLVVGQKKRLAFVVLVTVLTVVVITFYLTRPEVDRNYGGVCCGFRWAFWLIPLWLLAMLPAADGFCSNRESALLAFILLAVSIFSAAYACLNPWSHPWIRDYWEFIEYTNWI